MRLKIAGLSFKPICVNTFVSTCGRIRLTMMLNDETTAYPWRAALDGKMSTSRYTTPYVAVMRTLKRMEKSDAGKSG